MSALDGVSDPLHRIRILIGVHIQSLLNKKEMHSVLGADMHSLSREPRREV